jgi:hypothetical protein
MNSGESWADTPEHEQTEEVPQRSSRNRSSRQVRAVPVNSSETWDDRYVCQYLLRKRLHVLRVSPSSLSLFVCTIPSYRSCSVWRICCPLSSNVEEFQQHGGGGRGGGRGGRRGAGGTGGKDWYLHDDRYGGEAPQRYTFTPYTL